MFTRFSSGFAAAFAVILLGACASPKSYVTLLKSPDGSTGKIVVSGNKGTQIVDQANYGVVLDGTAPAAPIPEEKLNKDFGEAMAARPLLPERFLLYFEVGGATLTAESMELLPKIIANAAKRPAVDVSIIGHTDTVGKPEANEKLALQRAQAIASQIQQLGLKAETLSVESHGERNLLVPTADEVSEPRNRRVEVSIR